MPELAVFKHRIEEGKSDVLREWGEEVHEREAEALEAMADEGIHTEAAFIEHDGDERYFVSFIEAENVEAAMAAFESSDHDIDDAFQRALAEALESAEPVSEFEPLYALAHPERP